ncbi:MAG: hypothetical protein MJZ75_01265 [Paludibacteraceae bacterium]|nr:hypothetical protein [Paludibacteraceae bacterium]
MKKTYILLCTIAIVLSANAAQKAAVNSHFIPFGQELLQEEQSTDLLPKRTRQSAAMSQTPPRSVAQTTDYDTVTISISASYDRYIEDYDSEHKICYCYVLDVNDIVFYAFQVRDSTGAGPENGKTYTLGKGLNNVYTQDYEKILEQGTDGSFIKTETETFLSVEGKIVTKEGHVYIISYYLDKTQEIRDSYGIIIKPAAGTTKEYRRKIVVYSSFNTGEKGIRSYVQSSSATMVECADSTVYWKNPISRYIKDTWIKGKRTDSTIVFPAKQPLFASSTYLYTIRWGMLTATGSWKVRDDYADDIILDIVNDSLILRGTKPIMNGVDNYFIGVFREKFSKPGSYSFYGYGDCCTNLYVPGRPLNLNFITPPDGMETEKMLYSAHDDTNQFGDVWDSVYVGWDNDTVYIKGMCPHTPEAWVKGVLEGDTVTFPANQYMGQFDLLDIWIYGGSLTEDDLTDFHIAYDADANMFIGSLNGCLLTSISDDTIPNTISAYNNLMIGNNMGLLQYDTQNQPFNADYVWADMDVTIDNGVATIMATNQSMQMVWLQLFIPQDTTAIPAGEYTISDSQSVGTALRSVGTAGQQYNPCLAGICDATGAIVAPWFMVSGKVVISYDEYNKMNVTIEAKNSYNLDITAAIRYEKLEPKAVVDITASNLQIVDMKESFGLYQYYGSNTEYEVILYSKSDTPDGTFTGNMISYANCIIHNGTTQSQLSVLEGEFTVTIDGNNYGLTGWMLGRDTVKYTFNFTGIAGAMEYDSNSDFTAEFDFEQANFDIVGDKGGLIDLNAINDANQMVSMYIYTDLEDGKLPAGTYPVNSSADPNTVLACPGYDAEIGIAPSYAGVMDKAGYLTAAWFFEGGTVTVDDNGRVIVAAINSYEKAISIVIKPEETGFRNVQNTNQAHVRKYIRNGRFEIEVNGVKHNALGF